MYTPSMCRHVFFVYERVIVLAIMHALYTRTCTYICVNVCEFKCACMCVGVDVCVRVCVCECVSALTYMHFYNLRR